MSAPELTAPSLREIRAAARRLAGAVVRTPVVPLAGDAGEPRLHLKLENLQPIGSFKLRGAGNAMLSADPGRLAAGVYTASAGNMAQGVAWWARKLGIRCSVVVPDSAARAKLDAIARLGGRIVSLPFDEWWQVLVDHGHPDLEGHFIHPVSDPAVIAGNGTIGLEIAEQHPGVRTVWVPYGGGGLSCGIAAALRALEPDCRVLAAEVSTAAPLSASLAAAVPTAVDYTPSFVDGIGSRTVLAEMWPLARDLLAGAAASTPAEIAAAVRRLAERGRIVAEGAGAAGVAAALAAGDAAEEAVCVVSGGNIDADKLGAILAGGVP